MPKLPRLGQDLPEELKTPDPRRQRRRIFVNRKPQAHPGQKLAAVVLRRKRRQPASAVQELQHAAMAVHLLVKEVLSQKRIPVGADRKNNWQSVLLAQGGFLFWGMYASAAVPGKQTTLRSKFSLAII